MSPRHFTATAVALIAAATAAARPADAPAPAEAGRLLVERGDGTFLVLDPSGTTVGTGQLTGGRSLPRPVPPRLSPDGRSVAYVAIDTSTPAGKPPIFQVTVRDRTGKEPDVSLPMPDRHAPAGLAWSADGAKLLVCTHGPTAMYGIAYETAIFTIATTATETLPLPGNVLALDWSADSQRLLAVAESLPAPPFAKWMLMSPAGNQIEQLIKVGDTAPRVGRLSPDGSKVLLLGPIPSVSNRADILLRSEGLGGRSVPYLLDVKSKAVTPLPGLPQNVNVFGATWSPDGGRIAYTWVELKPTPVDPETQSKLPKGHLLYFPEATLTAGVTVCDADGRNPNTIATGQPKKATDRPYTGIDWR